jgi:hypothetical protein
MKTISQAQRGMAKWIGFAIAALFQTSLSGATYFVAMTGSDADVGSTNQPWRTIQKAANISRPGDIVIVAPGFYQERVVSQRSGVEGAPITFKSDGVARVHGFQVNDSYITISGFEITGEATTGYSGAIDLAKPAQGIKILNAYLHDLPNSVYGISFGWSVNAAGGPQNCCVSNCVFNSLNYHATSVMGANHELLNNRFEALNGWDAHRVHGSNHVFRGNTYLNWKAKAGIGNHPDILQNIAEEGLESQAIVFEGNYVRNIESQICQLNAMADLDHDGVPDVVLTNTVRNWLFRNNVFVDVTMAANLGVPACKWYNNLFYRCTTNTGAVLLWNWAKTSVGSEGECFNNIFVFCGYNPASPYSGWYYADPAVTSTFRADYNFVAGTIYAAKSPSSFTELHGINGGNPMFRAPAMGDFHLLSGSPVISAGLRIQGFSGDFDGNARPLTNWTIGPFEFRKSVQPPQRFRVIN